MSTEVHNDSPEVNAEAAESGNAIKISGIPAKALGKVLDHGKVSAYAVHLLAIKCAHGPGFVLSERGARKHYGIKRDNFYAGLRLLKSTGVLERSQPNKRGYAKERLDPPDGFRILFPETLLSESSKVIAFCLTANLATGPRRPADIAARIGIISKTTIRKLANIAIEHGCAWNDPGQGQTILLARRGYVFDPAKKSQTKKSQTHSRKRDSHSGMKGSSPNVTRPSARADQGEGRKKGEPIILADWSATPHLREKQFSRIREQDIPATSEYLDFWRALLAYHGGDVPDHLKTPHACRQALEIAKLFQVVFRAPFFDGILTALAYWICDALAKGRTIRSLGFIVERLSRQVGEGDFSGLLNLPSRMDGDEFDEAFAFAEQAITAFQQAGFNVETDLLLSTFELEGLAATIREHGHDRVANMVNEAVKWQAGSDRTGWIYEWKTLESVAWSQAA